MPDALITWQRSLVLALLRPAARLARRFHLPLRTFEDLARLAAFEAMRQGGRVSQAEVARATGVSLRTIGTLERQARDGVTASAEERAHLRHLEERLGLLDGATAAELAVGFPDLAEEVLDRLLGALVAAGRLRREGQGADARYRLDPRYVSLVAPERAARLDGLNHQLEVLGATVEARFTADGRPALARTLTFVATPEALEALFAALPQQLRAACGAAEEASLDRPGQRTYGATFAVGPLDAASETESGPEPESDPVEPASTPPEVAR
jgi:transcriptional regulator with XRE-family HTH domain